MLFYVECGIEFTNMYGDINEAFYYSMVEPTHLHVLCSVPASSSIF